MTFLWPGALAALAVVPVVVAGYVWFRRNRRSRAGALAGSGLGLAAGPPAPGPSAAGTGPARPPRTARALEHLPIALFTLAIAALAVACARPTARVVVPRQKATMILDIDVSASMGATDAAPSRLAVAKAAARYLVRHAPGSARIGVVAFGPTAVIVERPTRDHAAAVRAIDALSRGGGTSVAAGILTGLEAIAGKSLHVAQLAAGGSGRVRIGYYGNATIVLVSDGEDSVHTDPLPPARLASAAGVRIDTLGVGTTEGTTLKLGTFEVATALSPSTLEGVARVSNGTYHPLGPLGHPGRPGHRHGEGDQALEAVNRAIVVHLGLAGERTEVTALFAAAGAVLLAAGAVVSIRSQGRVV